MQTLLSRIETKHQPNILYLLFFVSVYESDQLQHFPNYILFYSFFNDLCQQKCIQLFCLVELIHTTEDFSATTSLLFFLFLLTLGHLNQQIVVISNSLIRPSRTADPWKLFYNLFPNMWDNVNGRRMSNIVLIIVCPANLIVYIVFTFISS